MRLPNLFKFPTWKLLLINVLMAGPVFILFAFAMFLGAYKGFEPESKIDKEQAVAIVESKTGLDIQVAELIKGDKYEINVMGDGTDYIQLSFPDKEVLKQIEADKRWKPLSTKEDKKDVYMQDKGFNQAVKMIKQGYWFYTDDQGGTGEFIQWRVNAVYDKEKDTMYIEVSYF